MISRPKVCAVPTCGAKYETVLEGELYDICSLCRIDLGIYTIFDARALLHLIESTPVSQIEAEVASIKASRRALLAQRGITSTATNPPAVKPHINLAAVKAGVRAMTTYGTLADDRDGPATTPTEYVIAQNGLFEIIHTDIADIVRIPKKVLGVDTALAEGVKMHLPPIPFSFLTQTVAFFKAVCQKHNNAEAFLRIWWNRAEARYDIQVPEQQVSGGGVHHNDSFDRENSGDWLVAADIHSHNTMTAFWSEVDNNDERKAPEGRIHGVIGKVPSRLPEWKWRMRVRDGFIDLNLADVFEVPTADVPFTIGWRAILSCLGTPDSLDAQGRLKLSCPVDPFPELTFPAEWMEQVKGYSTIQRGGGGKGRDFSVANVGGSAASRFSGTQFLYILNHKTGIAEEHEVKDGEVGKATGASFRVFEGGTDSGTTH